MHRAGADGDRHLRRNGHQSCLQNYYSGWMGMGKTRTHHRSWNQFSEVVYQQEAWIESLVAFFAYLTIHLQHSRVQCWTDSKDMDHRQTCVE
mmetsp:Transcript_59896/g.113066  ORF Transcript_59896/g.113066 Transcript_59896/m.113066 type:complete len:92 (-) Transcript_59896:220-495(-)